MTIRRNHRAFSLRLLLCHHSTHYIRTLSPSINNLRLRADLHLGLHQGAPLHFYADIDFYSHSRAPHTGYISRRGWKKCMCAHVKIYKIYRGEHMMYIYFSALPGRTLAHPRRTQISKWNFFRTHLFCDTSLLNYVHWRYSRTNSRAERCFAANRTGQFNDPLLTILDCCCCCCYAWRSILCQVALCARRKSAAATHITPLMPAFVVKKEKWNFAMKLWSWEWKGAKLRHIYTPG